MDEIAERTDTTDSRGRASKADMNLIASRALMM